MTPADIVSIITALTTLITTIAVLLRQTDTHNSISSVDAKVNDNTKRIDDVKSTINGRVDELVAAAYKSGTDDANKPEAASEGA